MSLFDRFRRPKKELYDSERQLLDLLLAGDTEFLRKLKSQWSEPFLRGIEREFIPQSVEIRGIFNGALFPEFEIAPRVTVSMADLVILDNRINEPIRIEGQVCDGILANIWLRTRHAVRWPSSISIDDWCYLRDGKVDFSNKTRTKEYDFPVMPHVSLDEALKQAPQWLRDLMDELPQTKSLWHVRYPASEKDIKEAEKRLGLNLPADLKEFLLFSNGASIGVDILLSAKDLETHPKHPKLLIFADEYGLDLEHPDGEGRYPVKYIDYEGELGEDMPSFRDWIKRAMTD